MQRLSDSRTGQNSHWATRRLSELQLISELQRLSGIQRLNELHAAATLRPTQ